MTLMSTLDALLRLETAMVDLYARLSEHFANDNPDAAGAFFRLSMQENGHANLIRYHKRISRSRPFDGVDLGAIAEQATQLAAHVESYRRNGNVSLGDALEFAILMEDSAAESIHAQLAAQLDRQTASFASTLVKDDQRHLEILKELSVNVKSSSAA
jgi:rubrerythrin